MVHETVEQGGGHDLVAQKLSPRIKALVARNDDRGSLVKILDEGEEEIRFIALNGCVADLVDDYEVGFREP